MASILLNLILIWFVGLAGVIFYRLLTGKIRTRGLLKQSKNGPTSPERIQMLVGTLVALGFYVSLALSSDDPSALPEPPLWIIALLGGSQLIYLAGKWFRWPGA